MKPQQIIGIIFLYFLLTILGCGNFSSKEEPLTGSFKNENTAPVEIDTLFFDNDTIVLANLVDEGKGAVLKWGVKGEYLNTGIDTLPYSNSEFGTSYKERNYYVIRDGCGSGCNYMYIMPFVAGSNGRLLLFPLFLDLEMHVVVYQGGNYTELAIIENIDTGSIFKVEEEFDRTQRPYSLAIDTLFLKGEELKIIWYMNDGKKASRVININEVLK
ncbi:MAG: hypothetical protein IPL49_21355 [Saprospirales bacterium]|nr:hypothetical protein [Saprospirales bacterium]